LDNINKKNAAIKSGIREGIDGGEAKKVKQLKQSIEILKDDLHRLKKEYRCTVTDIQEDSRVKGILEEELKQSNEEEERLQKSCEELESEIGMLESDVDDIKKKVINKIQRHRKEFCEKNEIFVDQVEAGTPVEKTAKAIVVTDVTKVRKLL
jgi:chromosome segregation ATPase